MKAAPGKLERTNTHCYARVYRHGGDPIDLVVDIAGIAMHGFGTITTATTTKSLSPNAGTWTLTLKTPHHRNVLAEISSGDWIVIWWEKNGVAYPGTLGHIDSVRRARRVNDGTTSTSWTLAGRDFAKVIEKTSVWFDDYSNFESNVGGKILGKRFNFVPGGTPDAVVENIVDAFLGGDGIVGGAWIWPRGLDWLGEYFVDGLMMVVQDGLGRVRSARVGSGAVDVDTAIEQRIRDGVERVQLRGELFDEVSLFTPQPNTKLPQLLMQWANTLLNEIFFDLVDGSDPRRPTPALYHRERPFVSSAQRALSPWFKLPALHLARHDVLDDDTGKSDEERINMVMLYSSNNGASQLDQYALYRPSYDVDSVRRHGICKLEESTAFSGIGGRATLGITGDSSRSWGDEVAEWHGLLSSWYALNHRFLSGTVKARTLRPEARVGRRLIVGEGAEREQFYVEGVSQEWMFPRGGKTTLRVTRGWIGSDDQLVGDVDAAAARFQREESAGGIVPRIAPRLNNASGGTLT